jgi:hypothetical protein
MVSLISAPLISTLQKEDEAQTGAFLFSCGDFLRQTTGWFLFFPCHIFRSIFLLYSGHVF